ncbi:MAG: hypothetical protein PSX80_02195 [bacterium]|nr:hypothetical protein [bacterium]
MKLSFAILILAISAVATFSQTASNDPWPFPDRGKSKDDSQFVKEMLAKQHSAREKKEYEALIERGEAAVKLSHEIEEAYERSEELSEAGREKLEDFEKLVSKIRKDLGGDDDGEVTVDDKEIPKDVREGFLYLKRSTEQLASEIKRSTRFSVSILAIESSNTLIRLARFLRLNN